MGDNMFDSFPPEILAHIFESGIEAFDRVSDKVTSSDEDGAPIVEVDNNLDNDCSKDVVLRFQVLVSHVCRRWRETAISTPVLWTHITFIDSTKDLEMTAEWIRRSKAMPLVVSLSFLFPEDSSRHPRGSSEPVTELSMIGKTVRAMELLVPEVARWRHFEMTTSKYSCMSLAVEAIVRCPAAPMLEAVRLFCLLGESSLGINHHPRVQYHRLFGGFIPNLREITLENVHADWSLFIPPTEREIESIEITPQCTTNLVEIHLSHQEYRTRPTFETFANILRCAPNLSSLKLSSTGFTISPSNEVDNPHRLALPMLRVLQLQSLRMDEAIHLVKRLYTPNLCNLELGFEESDCTPLLHALMLHMKPSSYTSHSVPFAASQNPLEHQISMVESDDRNQPNFSVMHDALGRPPSMLSNITEMKISNMMCTYDTAQSFYYACPRLMQLYLNMHLLPDVFLFSLMRSRMHIIQLEMLGSARANMSPVVKIHPTPAPLLERLIIVGASAHLLKAFVDVRTALRCSLKELVIDEGECNKMEMNTLCWLDDHVESLKTVSLSDGMTFEDEDEGDSEYSENEGEEEGGVEGNF